MTAPEENWTATAWLVIAMLLSLIGILMFARAARADVPAPAIPYQRMLVREARVAGGMQAPVALFAGQIEQESGWNPNAKSAYAAGLAQFTPQTAAWISGAYPASLGDNQPTNPGWAVRALIQYDLALHSLRRVAGSGVACEQWAFVLSAYNGGAGWLPRDRAAALRGGADPDRWFGAVELFNGGRSAIAFRENRGYPRRILLTTQLHYASWGELVPCTSR